MATIAPTTPTFNGSSSFAAQLQANIAHAVAIASMPMTQLQTSQTALTGRQTELQAIANSFSTIQTAVASLDTSTGLGGFASTVSDPSIAAAAISTGVLAGSYALNVTDIGSQSNSISNRTATVVTDPSAANIDPSTSFTLSVTIPAPATVPPTVPPPAGATTPFTISDTDGTLNGLAAAINSSSGNVQASIINVGNSTSPDYRLSVQSLDYGGDTLALTAGTDPTNLLRTLTTGTNVAYTINGQPDTPIQSTTRSAILSPGLTVQLLKAGPTQVTVAPSTTNTANALASFATGYNSIVAELAKNRGLGGGTLTGDSIISQLQNQLRGLANFSGATGAVSSMTDLGLTFDQSGNLQFDAAAFNKTASLHAADLANFIGSSTSGGFLETATNALDSITDPTSGSLASAFGTISTQLTSIAASLTSDQARVTLLQATLTQQMANADTLISGLQSQLSEVTTLFATMHANQIASSGL